MVSNCDSHLRLRSPRKAFRDAFPSSGIVDSFCLCPLRMEEIMTPNPTVKPMEAMETLDRAVARLKSEIDSFYLCTINGDTRSMIKAAQPVVDAYAALVENYAALTQGAQSEPF